LLTQSHLSSIYGCFFILSNMLCEIWIYIYIGYNYIHFVLDLSIDSLIWYLVVYYLGCMIILIYLLPFSFCDIPFIWFTCNLIFGFHMNFYCGILQSPTVWENVSTLKIDGKYKQQLPGLFLVLLETILKFPGGSVVFI